VAAVLLMLVAVDRIEAFRCWRPSSSFAAEIIVTGLREFLAELRVKVPVSRMAKWKTTAQILALGFLIGGKAGPDWLHGHRDRHCQPVDRRAADALHRVRLCTTGLQAMDAQAAAGA
jgi:phosphatidylglycerophosphate synthase